MRADAETNNDGIIPPVLQVSWFSLYYKYDILREYEIITDPSETLYNPCPSCMAFHVLAFNCGWRLPMKPTVKELFQRHTSLCPTKCYQMLGYNHPCIER